MQNHINAEFLRIENENPKIFGGVQLRSMPSTAARDVFNMTRKAVAQTESNVKLEDIKTSVDRFTVDKYFNKLSTSIANVVNNYLQGIKQNDTGSIVTDYNELCMYLKTVINWKTLSETDKNTITAKFNELIPQVNELMDVAITEKYTDIKQIEELRNNLMVRNYAPILYLNFADAIKSKKPDYKTRKELSTKLFTLLNEPMLDDAIKEQIEDKIEVYDEARNKFVSAKNADRKKFYKSILDKQERELNVYIEGIFRSIPQIDLGEDVYPSLSKEELSRREEDIGLYIPKPKGELSLLQKMKLERGDAYVPYEEVPTRKYTKEEQSERRKQLADSKRKQSQYENLSYLNKPYEVTKESSGLTEEDEKQFRDFSERKYEEAFGPQETYAEIGQIKSTANNEIEILREKHDEDIDNLEQDSLKQLKRIKFMNKKNVDALIVSLNKINADLEEFDLINERIRDYKTNGIAQKLSVTRKPDVRAGYLLLKEQNAKDKIRVDHISKTIAIMRMKEQKIKDEIAQLNRNHADKKQEITKQFDERKKQIEMQYRKSVDEIKANEKVDVKQRRRLLPEAELEQFQKRKEKKKDIGRSIEERNYERMRREEYAKPGIERRKRDIADSKEYYKEQKQRDREQKAYETRERKLLKDAERRLMTEEEKAMEQEYYDLGGEGKPRKGKGRTQGAGGEIVERKLRNAIRYDGAISPFRARKPFIPKNSNENDPSVNLYPTFDLSKFDIKIKK